jgi:hypothetical protein
VLQQSSSNPIPPKTVIQQELPSATAVLKQPHSTQNSHTTRTSKPICRLAIAAALMSDVMVLLAAWQQHSHTHKLCQETATHQHTLRHVTPPPYVKAPKPSSHVSCRYHAVSTCTAVRAQNWRAVPAAAKQAMSVAGHSLCCVPCSKPPQYTRSTHAST